MTTIQRTVLFLQKFIGLKKKSFTGKILRQFSFLIISVITLQSFAQAQTGEMLAFDGNDDHIVLGNYLPSGSYTKEAWVNANFFGGSNGSIVSGTASAFWAPNGRIRAGHSASNIFNDVQAPAINAMVTGTWYHVAVTYNSGTNILTLYLDGVQVATGPATGTYAETNLFIGAFNPNPSPNSVWDGNLDEVRLWNVARTGAEIANNRNCILTGDEPGLVAYYDFNQGIAAGNNPSESTLLDRSDKCVPNNGTLMNFNLGGAGGSNWDAPGAGVAGSCGGTFANISLVGNSVCITDGDATPAVADHTDFNGGLTRTFTIQNTGSATLNISSITFSGANPSEFSVTSAPAATVAPAGSTTFTVTFTPATNGTKSAIVNVNNDDGDEAVFNFNIAAAFFTLPVQLKSFTVKKVSTQSLLTWVTASETNNAGFNIERSADTRTWTSIAFIMGAGTSTSERTYNFTDAAPKKGINYYRIKQVDLDNKETYSEIRSVTFANQTTLVYPVPTKDKVIIELSDQRLIGTQATIADQQGKLVRRVTITAMQQEISLSSLPAGIYLLKMDDGMTHKLIKQ